MYNDDYLDVIKQIEDKSIDFICTDPPYNITQNSWDKEKIDLDEMWKEYMRVIKDDGAIAIFSAGVFTAKLIMSNEKFYRYDIIWSKSTPTGHLNSKRMPLRSHENILLFYKKLPTYNPQKTTGHPRKVSTAKHKRNSKQSTNYGEYGLTTYDSTERYPKSVWAFSTDKQKSKISPTQKPVKLVEELIKTYTNEGDLVLDTFSGSGTTAVACDNLKRNWICVEMDEDTHSKATDRVVENKGLLIAKKLKECIENPEVINKHINNTHGN